MRFIEKRKYTFEGAINGSTTYCLILLTIILSPLYILRFKIGPIPTTFLEILILVTFLSFLWDKWGRYQKKEKTALLDTLEALKNPFLVPGLVFIMAGTLSVFVSRDFFGALGILRAYIIEPFIFFLIILETVKTKKRLGLVFISLMVAAIWISLLCIAERLFFWNPFAPHELAACRCSAVFNSGNSVGLFLGPILSVLGGLSLAFSYKGSNLQSFFSDGERFFSDYFLRFLSLATILLGLVAIFLSGSLGAMVAVNAVFLFFTLRLLWAKVEFLREKNFYHFFLGFWGILGILFFVFFLNVSRFTPDLEKPPSVRQVTGTESVRFCLWEGTRNMLIDRSIFGVGLNSFPLVYKDYRTCDDELLQYPHNIILNFWSEIGLLGLLGFLGICFIFFKLTITRKLPVTSFYINLSLAASLIYTFVHGLVDVPYFKNDLSLIFWVILGVVVLMEKIVKNGESGDFEVLSTNG